MPSTSTKQKNFMAMCDKNPSNAKGKCPPAKVAKEYHQADLRAKGKGK